MRAVQKTFAEELERVLVESDTSVRRLARLSGISRRTLENWLYRHTPRPRYVESILQIARGLQLHAMDTDRLLLSAGYPTLSRLRQNKQLQPDILLAWQLPPDSRKGQKHSALQHAQRLLRQMPWNEEAHREVMELLALNGRRSEALKQFEICKETLRDELDAEPSAETLALYERIRRSAHFSRDNIPAVVTPLIGREQEQQTLSNLLADPDVRLVTISGLGGVGKTRLALEVAWQQTEGQFRDGVTFVQLAGVEVIELLVPTIARALHVSLQVADEQAARKELLDYLKPKQLLLVLDNCEHLLDGIGIAADILQAAPQVQILATSRERLQLYGEHAFALRGLSTEGEQTKNPAALLFSSAARRVAPSLAINADNAANIQYLCRMVEGMPLALELAAAWLNTLSVAEVVAEVEESLDFLATDTENILPRHRSLRAVLDSTWKGLRPPTRQVLCALSVFRGSFSLDAAKEVGHASPRLLAQLVTHSLLEFDREAERYRLHEMMRQFAAEKLAEKPEFEQAVTRRHFVYYSDLAQRSGAAMRGGDQVRWKARLELEQSNIFRAIDWAFNNDIEAAARLAISLHVPWATLDRSQEAIQQYERLMTQRDGLSTDTRSWLLAVYAEMLLSLGRFQEAVLLVSEAMPLFLEQGKEGLTFAYALLSRAASYSRSDEIDVSIQLAETGLQYAFTHESDSYYASFLLEFLGESLIRAGRLDEADERVRQGYQLCLQRGDRMYATYFLYQMSFLASARDQAEESYRLCEECLRQSRQLGMLRAEILALENLGLLEYEKGDLDRAEDYLADYLALCRETNYQFYLAGAIFRMGDVLAAKGSFAEALPYLREAATRFQAMNHQSFVAEVIECLAEWAWRAKEWRSKHWQSKKDVAKPARWLACALTQLALMHNELMPCDQRRFDWFKAELEVGLGEEAFVQAWSEGEQLTLNEALEEQLLALPEEIPGNE